MPALEIAGNNSAARPYIDDVTATSTFTPPSEIDRIFGPVVEPQTYRNLLYSFISFPFGLMAFVMVLTGLAIGIGLAVILVGFVILALTMALARGFAVMERSLARSLLGAGFETSVPAPQSGFRAGLTDRRSWTSAAYFVLRFPLVVVGFVVSVVLVSSVPVIATPLLYTTLPVMVGGERVTTTDEAMLVSLAGCVLFLLAVHAVNGIAAISRRMAVALL